MLEVLLFLMQLLGVLVLAMLCLMVLAIILFTWDELIMKKEDDDGTD